MRLLEGNPSHRPINSREPTYEPHSGRAPEGLTSAALAEWNRRAPALLGQGLLTVADEPMLVAWCETWADLVEARDTLAKHYETAGSYSVVSSSGFPVTHPAFNRKCNAIDRLSKLSPKFGNSPSDRAKIETPEGATETNTLSKFQRRA